MSHCPFSAKLLMTIRICLLNPISISSLSCIFTNDLQVALEWSLSSSFGEVGTSCLGYLAELSCRKCFLLICWALDLYPCGFL
jgi:hypothetical protein